MRRVGGLWEGIVAFENLLRAARRASLGKRDQAGVARFLCALEPECLRLERELRDGSWRPGRPSTFTILDPKERVISAAPFRDRVVHHAVMAVLEPVFERRMVAESFACRRGKGTHAALAHARGLVRRFAWFLKLDVAKCFESLDHEVVLGALARVVKDRRALMLIETIVRAGGEGGRGLPIGNLTSQWLANLVLDRLDHHVKEIVRPGGYVRYMDDFALFAGDKESLRTAHGEVAAFLAERLSLALKARATILAPARTGLPFLGWRIYPALTRLRPQNLRHIRRRLRHRAWEARTGRAPAARLVEAARSIAAHLARGQTLALRRRLFAPGAPGSVEAATSGPGPPNG